MKNALKSLVLTLAASMIWMAPLSAAEVIQPNGVVELFTSQGCSSCPPADRLLGKLADENKTLVLAWHVDYWDYLGWKDVFGSETNTTRQRRYAISLGERQIYTPQAIINGRKHVVGSKERQLRAMINGFSGTANGLSVPIEATFSSGAMNIKVAANEAATDATLWIVYFDNRIVVDVKRGENSGKKLAYSNIVRDVQMVGMMKGNGIQMSLPLSEMKRKGTQSCALILQKTTKQGTPGPIIGAAIIRDL